jgi:LVIVD repeat
MKVRLSLLVALGAALAVPTAATAHPSNATNSFIYGLGGAAGSLTQPGPVDDGGAQFTKTPNMTLKSFTPRPLGTPNAFGDFISDLAFWGDTVYQGTFDGFRIIDIDDVRNPVVLNDFDDCANANGAGQGDVVVWGSILVRTWDSNTSAAGVTCDGDPVPAGPSGGPPGTGGFEGLHVFDVSDPGNPDLVASVDLTCGSHTASGVPDLRNRRLLVYSTPSSGNCDGIDIVEVPLSRPSEAEFLRFEPAGPNVAGADGFACHDTGVILGRAMKAACAGGLGFAVWSLGGKDGGSLDNPRFLYNHALPEIAAPPAGPAENADNPTGHSASFSYDGETIIFGHEPGGGVNPRCQANGAPISSTSTGRSGFQTSDMKSFFFFDTDSGQQVGKWTLTRNQTATENCTLHNYNLIPTARDDILVQGSYQSGTGVLDISNPANAREVAFADPAPLPDPPGPATIYIGGSWATYFYNGYLFESDITRGLYIWHLDDKDARSAVRQRHSNPQTQEFTIGAKKDHERWNEDDRWHGGKDDDDRGDD